jgi:GAF domain-containing protein
VEVDRPHLAVITDPQRLAALRATSLLDAPAVEDFDRVTRMAAELLEVPVVLVSLVDSERQFFLSCVGLGRPASDERETPLSHSFCQYVVAGEEPLVIADARAVPWLRDNLAIPDLGMIAYAGFPLRAADGQPIGSFCAIDDKPHEWSERELDLLRDFSAIVQSELDLRAARDAARNRSALLGRLQVLTDAAAAGRGLDELLEDVVAGCVDVFGADLAVIDLVDGNGHLLRRAARGLGADSSGAALRLGEGFAGRVATSEQAISVYDVRAVENADGLQSSGVRSLLAAPLIVDARLQGAVYVGADSAGAYGEPDRELLAVAAERFAAAIARAGAYERDRLVARTLVAALQPSRLPAVPGVRLAARYLPAERGLGGDWYDVFRLPAGSLGVAIGDVVGHGIEAAAEAVRLRNALRGAVLEGCTPADAVAALNRHAALHPGAYASTVVYLELDAGSRRVRWASAGHLPGVVAEDGAGEWLGLADGPPLGVTETDAWPGAERTLAHGARIVLFTDGLIERRAEPLDDGIDRLVAAAATAPDLERLCEAAVAQAPAPRFDDLALIALELD